MEHIEAAIIGGGPAGLAAAEALLAAGIRPVVFEAKPTLARKFLMAGKSGLNLTREEAPDPFLAAFGCHRLAPMIGAFGAEAVRGWAEGLGEPCFTGSTGRVFPVSMKGSPLLRKWLGRLDGAETRTRWRWEGLSGDALVFSTLEGRREVSAKATVLALGGASWPRLGSDAAWVPWLEAAGVAVAPFQPANMGFARNWSDHFRERFAGAPVKGVSLIFGGTSLRGEFVITARGIEGGAVYALSAAMRDAARPVLTIDLMPDRDINGLVKRLSEPKGKASLATHLRKKAGIEGVKAGLLRELAGGALGGPVIAAEAIKGLRLPLEGPLPIEGAISSAGGVAWDGLDESLMLRALPGIFAAGEMLDWEAPTGGYLLTGCLATGRWAGQAAARFLAA